MDRLILKRFRFQYELSQHDVAKILGVSQSVISLIETGRRSMTSAEWNRILKFMGHEKRF